MNTGRKKILTRQDAVLLVLLALIGALITFWIYSPAASGEKLLEIRQNGTVIKTVPLNEDHTETIVSENGGHNTFCIKNGSVAMTGADCGDHTCMNTGQIRNAGESIICLPHRLTLQIVKKNGAGSGDTPDVIVR